MTQLPRAAKGARMKFMPIVEPGEWTVTPAQYARGKAAVICDSYRVDNPAYGTKTRAMRLCDALGMQWSNRERCYIATPAAAEKFMFLWATPGADGELGRKPDGSLGYVLNGALIRRRGVFVFTKGDLDV